MGKDLKIIRKGDNKMDNAKKYESEEGTVERLIEDEIFRAFDQIKSANPQTPEYAKAINSIGRLHSMWMDEEKLGLDYADRVHAREHELDMEKLKINAKKESDDITHKNNVKLEQMKIDAKKESDDTAYQIKRLEVIEMHKIDGKDIAQFAMDLAKTVIPIGALVGITVLGWHNENNPIKPLMVTSNTTRNSTGILGKFIK